MKRVIIFVILIALILLVFVNIDFLIKKRKKINLIKVEKIDNCNLYLERYSVDNSFYNTDGYTSIYLTDSVTFRKYILTHSTYSYTTCLCKDGIVIIKNINRTDSSKSYGEIKYSISKLTQQGKFE
jgi:hypothetical protein